MKNLIFFTVVFLMTGCMRPQEIVTADTDPLGWHVGEKVVVGVDNHDTVSVRSLSLLFRFDGTFRQDSIALTVKVTTPDSLWYEEGFSAVPAMRIRANNDFFESAVLYRKGVVLSREGRYTFEIANAGGGIHGLWGVGVVVE